MVPRFRKSDTRLTLLLSLSALVVLSAGCKVTLDPKVPSSATVKAIPQDMGIYFSPEFRSYEFRYQGYKITGDPGDKESFAIGKASVDLFKELFGGMFRSTVEVKKGPPSNSSGAALAGVIEPNIEEFTLTSTRDQPRSEKRYRVRLTYRFTLYARDGTMDVFWVTGFGSSIDRRFVAKSKIYGEATDEAMKNAAKRFSTDFEEFPEVQKWLDSVGDSRQK